jgi:Zn-dependent peptidase ImmA (M78 family)
MSQQPVNKSRIQERVRQLLRDAKVANPPIPIERIARDAGAVLRYEPFEGDLSGLLFREGEQVIIGVNALHSKTRQRFTIAHELGHLILHASHGLHVDRGFPTRARDSVSSQAVDAEEIQANTFAAELLMPSDLLREDLQARVLDFENDTLVPELADRYKVSTQAMTFRLVNLGIISPSLPSDASF